MVKTLIQLKEELTGIREVVKSVKAEINLGSYKTAKIANSDVKKTTDSLNELADLVNNHLTLTSQNQSSISSILHTTTGLQALITTIQNTLVSYGNRLTILEE